MATRWYIVLGMTLWACHVNALRAPSVAPPEAGVALNVTDLATARELPGVRMDGAGQVMSALPPGRYAIAATTETSFAFFEKAVAPGERLVIPLSPDCHRVTGRINSALALALPATVSLWRYSSAAGDKFVVPIQSNGQFFACLPNGAYSTRVEGSMASLTQPVVVPNDATVELTVYAASQLEHGPEHVEVGDVDMASFAQSLLDRRVIGLGEANHGTGDFYTYREKLSLELARRGKLRGILFEADAVGMMAIDDYVMGADIDLAKAVVALGFWITDVQEFLDFLKDVRSFNAAASSMADRIHVLGIDAQRVEPPVQYLLAHRAELAITDDEAALLSQIAPKHGAAFSKLSGDERATLSLLLGRLDRPAGKADLDRVVTRASIASRSIRYQLGYLDRAVTISLRDQAMAELGAYIVEVGKLRQAVIWAHNGHIARQHDDGAKTLGQCLAETFGEQYYPVAFLSYRGAGRAWDQAGKIGVIPHELAPPPAYNVESVIMNATRFVDVAWVRLDKASDTLSRWLSLPRYVREFGSVYDPGDTQRLRGFPWAVAAVVVIRQARPSTPTPTGVRMVTP